jgi:hypothetical protein
MELRDSWPWIAVLLAGCGGGGGSGVPPERPISTVSGIAIDGPLVSAEVRIYSFKDGFKGAQPLVTTVTNADGRYSVDFKAESQPIWVEVDGGYYLEDADLAQVTVPPGGGLAAVADFVSGGPPLTVNLTPLTLLAAGLAEYRLGRDGGSVSATVRAANQDILLATGVDAVGMTPLGLGVPADAAPGTAQAGAYAFFLGAYSNYTAALVSEQQAAGLPVTHQDLPSIGLARVMYEDIRADGVLDGKGSIPAGGGEGQLSFGDKALSPAFYRVTLAQHMAAVTNSAANKTGLTWDDVGAFANIIGSSRSAILPPNDAAPDAGSDPGSGASGGGSSASSAGGGSGGGGASGGSSGSTEPPIPPPPADDSGPIIASDMAAAVYRRGKFVFSVSAVDPSGVASVKFDVDGTDVGAASDLTKPQIEINTAKFADGPHKVGVGATDSLGFTSYALFPVLFDNSGPQITVTSAGLTNQLKFTLEGTLAARDAPAADTLQVAGTAVPVSGDGKWSAKVTLKAGKNELALAAVDSVGNPSQATTVVLVDGVPPEFVTRSSNQVSLARSDGSNTCREAAFEGVTATDWPVYLRNSDLASLKSLVDAGGYTARDLDSLRIPYVRFSVEDPLDVGVGSAPGDIRVRLTYSLNGAVKVADRALAGSVVAGKPVYLLAIAPSTLHQDFATATATDVHSIQIELRDAAGNLRQWPLSFRTAFGDEFCPVR